MTIAKFSTQKVWYLVKFSYTVVSVTITQHPDQDQCFDVSSWRRLRGILTGRSVLLGACIQH